LKKLNKLLKTLVYGNKLRREGIKVFEKLKKDLEKEYNREFTLREITIIHSIYEQGKEDGKAEQGINVMKVLTK
jgi:hypothetical protein